MSSRTVGGRRSPWPGRIAVCVASSAILVGLAFIHAPSRVRIVQITERLVTSFSLVDPVLVKDYFLLQATLCPWRYGFSCAPDDQPASLRVVPGRRTIEARNTASRAQARALIEAEFKGGAASWSTVAVATPGAAFYTLRFLAGFGWGFWLAAGISVAMATAIVFSLLDISIAAFFVAVVAAAGVAWLLATGMPALAAGGWVAQLAASVTATGLTMFRLKDIFMASDLMGRIARSRRKRALARQE